MSANSRAEERSPPHIALLPSAGMGHVAPFTRLAAALSSHGCRVTLIAAETTVSSAESLHFSHLLSSFPSSISLLPLPLIDLDPSQFPADSDPFYLRYEAIRRSSHLLSPILSSSSFSALVVDIGLSSAFVPIAKSLSLSLPCYIFFTTSAAMLAFYAYFPTYLKHNASDRIGDVDVPGLWTVPRSSVVPGLHNPAHFFYEQFVENGMSFPMADGILANTFNALEGETLKELNKGSVVRDLCPVLAIGPLRPIVRRRDGESTLATWLDRQPQRSVVYVSFGSRTAMTAEQIKELGDGLEKSQCRFLWVIKTKKVDRDEDTDTRLEEILGEGYTERVKNRAMIINGWVEQEEILSHKSIGMFLTHCGWNSLTEAMMSGVKVMAWPRGADQRINGEVVRRSGVGVWMEEWSWEAEDGVVSGDEIARRVREVMECNEGLMRSEGAREESMKALEVGGSSYKVLDEFIAKF